ncbi:ferrochelatase [Oceanicoccus sp. KOV_DT_Chl]|uniref:ferrochelatase n=1 Tax=Oceanicoccus sp. KOV_DT_Chl TaxID=1904639 RepID=UPI000C79E9DF|nr:ferrochelatase [Oceanicoccus sp. KOV_DT_Chl]
MKTWKKIGLSIGSVITISAIGLYATYTLKNAPAELQEPNYYSYYQQQDTQPEGKVGIYISQMILPETYDEEVYYNVFFKPLKIIPWPIRELLKVDNGTPLYDAERYFETKEFTPTRLVDHNGNDTDTDGLSYVEKYHQGKISFVEGSDAATPGYFLFKERKAGMPTRAASFMAKAQVYYHRAGAGLADGRVPEEAGIKALVAATMQQVEKKYGAVSWRWANTEKYSEARKAMFELLNGGANTIVFAPPRPIMSHYEEFNASVRLGMEYIKEWEKQHNKEIKTIIAPQLADFPELRQAYLNLLRDQLASIPKDKSVKVVASFHGMPWEMVENEAWLQLSKPYLSAMQSDITKTLQEEHNFARTEVIIAQDYFAEMTDMYQSTNDAFWQGIEDNYDYVINLPVEFITENTDTLFAHALMNFQGFDGYDVYQTIDYTNWDEPLAREFKQGDTTIIYTSVPVGKYRQPLVQAHFKSIDSILSQGMTPTSI